MISRAELKRALKKYGEKKKISDKEIDQILTEVIRVFTCIRLVVYASNRGIT